MVALKLWHKDLAGKWITILCDNIASVMVLNRGLTQDAFQGDCLREITYLAATSEFALRGQHIAGCENRIPDLLSRWDKVDNPLVRLHKLTGNMHIREVPLDDKVFAFEHNW